MDTEVDVDWEVLEVEMDVLLEVELVEIDEDVLLVEVL